MGAICYLDFSGGGKSFLKPKEKDPEPDYNLPKKDFNRKGKGENTTSNFASKNFKRETASSSKKVFIKSLYGEMGLIIKSNSQHNCTSINASGLLICHTIFQMLPKELCSMDVQKRLLDLRMLVQFQMTNMMTKQILKCLRSSMILLHYPSNAVTKIQICYP